MKLHAAYIAGFFDGEGHVHHGHSPNLTFTQADRTILDAILLSFLGGHIYRVRNKYNGAYNLVYNGRKAEEIAQAMLPFLIGKHLEVQTYLSDLAMCSSS
jgi:hypothetical protein